MSPSAVFLAIFAVLFFLVMFYRFERVLIFRIIIRRGYSPPAAAILTLVAAIGSTVTAVCLLPIPAHLASTIQNPLLQWLVYILCFVLACLAACGFSLGLVAALPQRNNRKFGPRLVRFPFRLAGQFMMIVGVSLSVLPVLLSLAYRDWGAVMLFVALGLFIFGLLFLRPIEGLFNAAKRAESAGWPGIAKSDSRAPVLFLRGFRFESEPFVNLTWLVETPSSAGVGIRRTVLTFEEFFVEETRKHLGPAVALGNPEDYLPPKGAARVYCDDVQWYEEFIRICDTAKCLFIRVSVSDNLDAELTYILGQGYYSKLFIMTPPKVVWEGGHSPMPWMEHYVKFPWRPFAKRLLQLGYGMNEQAEPPLGSVIGFDSSCKSKLLLTGAQYAEEYITAIAAELSHGREVKGAGACDR